jgi:hypothetical protein
MIGPSAIELDPVQPRRAVADIERGARIAGGFCVPNMRHDPEQEYFADGMVEEVITALCRHNRSSHHGSAR